jgi:type IV secretory pathway TrbL component
MVLTLVLGVGNNIFQALKVPAGQTVTTYQAFCIALAALLLMVLSLVASRLATDMIIGGPSLGVGTSLNTMAVAYNTSVNTATSRPALLAVKAAAVVPTKGATLVSWAGKAAYGGIRKAIGGGVSTASSVPASSGSSKQSSAPGATNVASRLPGSTNSPPSAGGSSNAGGKQA